MELFSFGLFKRKGKRFLSKLILSFFYLFLWLFWSLNMHNIFFVNFWSIPIVWCKFLPLRRFLYFFMSFLGLFNLKTLWTFSWRRWRSDYKWHKRLLSIWIQFERRNMNFLPLQGFSLRIWLELILKGRSWVELHLPFWQ